MLDFKSMSAAQPLASPGDDTQLRELRQKIDAASEVGNHALAARLTMLYVDRALELTGASGQGAGPVTSEAHPQLPKIRSLPPPRST